MIRVQPQLVLLQRAFENGKEKAVLCNLAIAEHALDSCKCQVNVLSYNYTLAVCFVHPLFIFEAINTV